MTTRAPYGSWTSPITADLLTSAGVGLSAVAVDGADVYWLEARPTESGRVVLVRLRDGVTKDVTPAPYSVRTMVHEYGGGAYDVRDGVIVFSALADGRIYVIEGADIRPLTPDVEGRVLRYADLRLDLARRRVLCVREDHRGGGEAVNQIVEIALDGVVEDETSAAGRVLVSWHDFVAAPRLSPDGRQLAWITWEHPEMPWDATTLWVGDAEAGGAAQVAGGAGVSVCDIGWLRDGRLAYMSDRTGYWNLTVDGVALHAVDRDCSDPAWALGGSTWLELPDGRILLREWRDAQAQLILLSADGHPAELPTSVVSSTRPTWVDEGDLAGGVVLVVSRISEPAAVVRLDPASAQLTVLRSASEDTVDPRHLPTAEAVTWQDAHGRDVHGFLYRPASPDFIAPEGDRPPLIVQSHGGPTAHTNPARNLGYAFWTSRGVAVLDVNYGGSTSYGRAYRERLKGQWGIVDVDDCCAGARWLAQRGDVDPRRMAISGGSAGGYTTLAALAFRDVFAAGVSRYGIGDLETLARDTHKFESRYPDGLVGPYPEARAVYLDRSPVHHVDGLDCAMLLLQGEDDMVVPPNQATAMADAVRAKGKPVALKMFAREGHGFRSADNQRAAIEAELSFYGQVFGFQPADDIPALAVDNL